jgi:SAM-dependent methyltransferase
MTIWLPQSQQKTGSPADWPTPPNHLMEYRESSAAHLENGRISFENMNSACAEAGFSIMQAPTVLEFGCSNGRITRWFDTSLSEVWGVDIQEEKILWAQANLGPPMRFMTTTTTPHLPFADGYFAFISALSVFTHIQALHLAWLMELCRLLSDGGGLFITIQDEEALDPSRSPKAPLLIERFFKGPLDLVVDGVPAALITAAPYGSNDLAQVFMSEDYLTRILPPWVEVVARSPRAYSDLQTGYLIRRTSR